MKKIGILCALLAALSLMLPGCGMDTGTDQTLESQQWDKIPMVMVDGDLYYDTGTVSTLEGRCGTPDGEITSTVDGTETPAENDQSNFGAGFSYQYGEGGTIELLIDGSWVVFEQREGDGSQVRFGDRWIDADGLSQETLDWLVWYNSLSEAEQAAVSSIPADLLEANGTAGTADAEAPAMTYDELCAYPTAADTADAE